MGKPVPVTHPQSGSDPYSKQPLLELCIRFVIGVVLVMFISKVGRVYKVFDFLRDNR